MSSGKQGVPDFAKKVDLEDESLPITYRRAHQIMTERTERAVQRAFLEQLKQRLKWCYRFAGAVDRNHIEDCTALRLAYMSAYTAKGMDLEDVHLTESKEWIKQERARKAEGGGSAD
ncbi:unnamed protein product [Pedinophyceae sp. YPF-701]|nr:unnamed protein product [Pedinophyceae sp. YPF-701]